MREIWARRIAFLTGLAVLFLTVVFAALQNPVETTGSGADSGDVPLPADTVVAVALDAECIEAGKLVYQNKGCARCHSIGGQGNPRNPLDGVGAKHSSETMADWIIGAESLRGVLPDRAIVQKQTYKVLAQEQLRVLSIYMQSLRPDGDAPSMPVEEPEVMLTDEDGTCLTCHTNAGNLMQVVKPAEAPPEDGCAAAPSRPPFLNAFVNAAFTDTTHGELGCTGCHGGDATTDDKTVAHGGMLDAEAGCVDCHADITKLHSTSLHGTLNGMSHALELRSGPENFHKLDTVWHNDCASCHASCSDCHVTLPGAVGGGLLRGHEFFKTPPMEDTCAVCHGTRAGAEYLGKWGGVEPDVHHQAGMHCIDCHTNDMHGDGTLYTSRWDVAGRSQCTDCHEDLPNDSVEAHMAEHDDMSCQTCHSQPYQNCFSCHAGLEDGAFFRKADHKGLDFKIGRNTVTGYPYSIVPLRNNPVSRDGFAYFGENLLPHFDEYPTWKTAAPHNIQRITPQNETCANCHGNADLFLLEEYLDELGSEANKSVIIPPARTLE